MLALIATDGSELAIDAARSARSLFSVDAEMMLVTVIPALQDPQASAGGFEGPAFSDEEAAEWAAEDARAGHTALENTAKAIGLDASPGDPHLRLVEGDDTGRQLCDLATEVKADVLVIGSSEKGVLRRLLLGSVMNHLVHHAPCPVLVVRHLDDPSM